MGIKRNACPPNSPLCSVETHSCLVLVPRFVDVNLSLFVSLPPCSGWYRYDILEINENPEVVSRISANVEKLDRLHIHGMKKSIFEARWVGDWTDLQQLLGVIPGVVNWRPSPLLEY